MDSLTYDPFDPAQVEDHWPIIADLRERGPVKLDIGKYYIGRYETIAEILKDRKRFAQGGMDNTKGANRTMDQKLLVETNPPWHTPVRKNFAEALRQSEVRTWYPMVRGIADKLVDGLVGRGEFDLVPEYSSMLPAVVIAELSGLPEELKTGVGGYSRDSIARDTHDVNAAEATPRAEAYRTKVREAVIARREAIDSGAEQASDKVDFIGALLRTKDADGHPLSIDRVMTHVTEDVIGGGVETTQHHLANTFVQIISQPGLFQELDRDRDLLPNVVNESMRRFGPVQMTFRRAVEDVEIDGVVIPEGATVLLGVAAGNLDPRRFADPDVFDVKRPEADRHLGFGQGIHLCVGAPLAKLESLCAIEAMLDRAADLRFAPDYEYKRIHLFQMYGPRSVKITPTWKEV